MDVHLPDEKTDCRGKRYLMVVVSSGVFMPALANLPLPGMGRRQHG